MDPFLKWAGGKRWLVSRSGFEIPNYERLVEPFLGGGAFFFAQNPKKALISDVNDELINLYEVVRDEPMRVIRALDRLERLDVDRIYYNIRNSKPTNSISRAIRTVYLNRTCWNGLYRLNQKGEFNVPRGTKTKIVLPNDDFLRASDALRNAEIACSDFESIIDRASVGDLIFADPPYTVKHNKNGFVKYNESIFSWQDQIRLRDACLRACKRGASVIVTNADHASVRDLYKEVGEYTPVTRASVLSGTAQHRNRTTEAIFRINP